MLDEKALKAAAGQLLQLVKKAEPRAEALVSANTSHLAHTRFARNTVTTTGDVDQASVRLAVRLGQRSAGAVMNQVDPASLQKLVERAVGMARLAPEDPEDQPVLGPQKFARSPAFDPKVDALDPAARAAAVRLALDAGKAEKLEVAGFLQHVSMLVLRATSAGFQGVQPLTDLRFSVTARTSDGSGSGWASATSRQRSQVDFEQVARTACRKAAASRSPVALEPGRYTVVLEPAAAVSLVETVARSLEQRSADEGRSAFSKAGGGTKQGEKLFSDLVTIVSRPNGATAPGMPFDDDCLALAPRTWVEKGVVKELAVSRYWAKKQGLSPTGSYGGLELLPGDRPPEALLQGVQRGVLITRFWYTNMIDPKTLALTGLTRDGTFLIENGQVTRPVNNFRFNQSAIDALARCDALSNESWGSPWNPDVRVPALRTHEFLLASKSDAV